MTPVERDPIVYAARPCPSWCVSIHDEDEGVPVVHRGSRRVADLRARRLVHTSVGGSASIEDTQFSAGLVQYASDATIWLRVETTTGEPLEISIDDANRWIVLMGSAMVDDGDPRR